MSSDISILLSAQNIVENHGYLFILNRPFRGLMPPLSDPFRWPLPKNFRQSANVLLEGLAPDDSQAQFHNPLAVPKCGTLDMGDPQPAITVMMPDKD